jgi:hypothetical protein
VAQNTFPWPPPSTLLQKIFISYIFAKDPVFWRDGHGLEGVKYRDNPTRPELQQAVRTTTGYEVIKNGLMNLESFEVTGIKEGSDSAGLPTYSASYHAQFISTMAFQVVPIKDGTGWRPDIEISNGPDLDYAVYVDKGYTLI